MDFPIFTLGGAKSLQGGAFLTIGFKKQAQGKKCSVLTDFPYSIQKHLVQYTIEIDELPLELMDVKSTGVMTNWKLSLRCHSYSASLQTFKFRFIRRVSVI